MRLRVEDKSVYLIEARKAKGKRKVVRTAVFANNGALQVTSAHVLFFNRYIANHPREAAMMSSMPLPNSPRIMMTLVGPVIGVVSGAIIGLLALVFARFVSPRKATAV